VREQKEVSQLEACAAPVAKFAITMRHRGKEQATDIPLSSAAIEALAVEAVSRDLDIAGLVGQVLVAAINKDMIHKILRWRGPALWEPPRRKTRRRLLKPPAYQCNKWNATATVGATIHAIYQRCECNANIISDAETAIVRKLIKRFNKWRSGYLKW
jgi:hypothetical protein